MDISEDSYWLTITPPSLAYELPFYLTEIGIFSAGSSYYTERKDKNTFLFLYTLSGEALLHYKESSFRLSPYSIIILDCNLYHHYQTTSDTPWVFKWFHFDGMCAPTYTQLLNDPKISPMSISDSLVVDATFDELIRLASTTDNRSLLAIAHCLTTLFTNLYNNKLEDKKTNKYYPYKKDMDKVLDFIHVHYQEPITLEDMISVLHISKFYFLKVFKYYLGVSPYDYLLHYRITQAKILLRQTQDSVGEIGLSVGFNSESHFIKQFKKIVHITPLAYRKSCL